MARIIGMVDSGAVGTLLPRSSAIALGIDPTTDLILTPGGSGGAGGTTFQTWTTSHVVTGQVVYSPAGGSQSLWGPEITFQPVFGDGVTLFGRNDFFACFTITFGQHPAAGPIFHLDC